MHAPPCRSIDFAQLDFNHPLWILFSSGTTGKPKAITHRAGGMLLQLAKEHLIHGGMTPQDVFFQYTTPGWMMWNFLVAGLVSGAPLVLFDGSPLRPSASSLWSLADKLGITVFGTSAAYLAALEKSGCEPCVHSRSGCGTLLFPATGITVAVHTAHQHADNSLFPPTILFSSPSSSSSQRARQELFLFS